MSRRRAVRLLSGLTWTAFCGCGSLPPQGDYSEVKRACLVDFLPPFNIGIGENDCSVNVRAMQPGLVRLDFSKLGLALKKGVASQAQMLTGNLRFRLQSPVKLLGFKNTLRLQVDKPKDCRVVVFSRLAGSYNKLDLDYGRDIPHVTLERTSRSMMCWPGSSAGWQEPPPYSVAFELVLFRRSGAEPPGIIIESLEIQALKA